MTLAPGTKLGPYEILSPIGAGGMGEVYKARDSRLERTVAVKVLPSHLAGNAQLRERFEREARAVSSLNHPHICTLHDVGEENGIQFLVMEYIEGETLADRLKKGALPLEQALRYGIQIADALDKAHRKGVVHRDLKPGNAMLTASGAKLLDFGLAKQQGMGGGASEASDRPTEAKPLTEEGTLLGTFQYMAPEQLEGKDADARTDLFAFGAVLYEMVTGKKAFEGTSQASLISAIMSSQPPKLSERQPMSSRKLEHIVERCLAKHPDERWQTASDVMRELMWADTVRTDDLSRSTTRSSLTNWVWPLVAAVVAGLSVAFFLPERTDVDRSVSRAVIPIADGDSFTPNSVSNVALSPDGKRLVYVAGQQLYVRPIESMEATPIAGTEGGSVPFFSPDGEWLGFFANSEMKKIALSGGAPVTLAFAPTLRGASWGPDDYIVFTPDHESGLVRVSAGGGEPDVLTSPDRTKNEKSHRFPQVLPGGKAVLFTIGTSDIETFDDAQIAVLSLESGEYKVVLEGGTDPRFAASGHLLYARGGDLLAVPFDVDRLEVTGSPVPVVQNVLMSPSYGQAEFSLSRDGTLVWVPGAPWGVDRNVVWIDREGNIEVLANVDRAAAVRLAPGGERLALYIEGANDDIGIYDRERGTLTRMTYQWDENNPVWDANGENVTFTANPEGARGMFVASADGSSPPERLTESEITQWPTSWSPDGEWLVYWEQSASSARDIWLLSSKDKQSKPLLATDANEWLGQVSPNGRFLAYVSDESGRNEVYVQPFPDLGRKSLISTAGGGEPLWSPAGRELFYMAGSTMMAVTVNTEGSFAAGRPTKLYEVSFIYTNERAFDVSEDGQRFLAVLDASSPEYREIHVAFDWLSELEALVPTR